MFKGITMTLKRGGYNMTSVSGQLSNTTKLIQTKQITPAINAINLNSNCIKINENKTFRVNIISRPNAI